MSPPVGPLPMTQNGYVTFGSFNNPVKITPAIMDLWGRLLRRCHESRLLIKCLAAEDPTYSETFRSQMQKRGVAPERLRFIGVRDFASYLEVWNDVDLALDAYPFNGAITTLEGLWMGVPIVTLTGDLVVSRVGQAILQYLGLTTFATACPDTYVEKACAFAQQPAALSEIRRGLRGLMINSPLCDPKRFARDIEAAYRDMWQRWCATPEPQTLAPRRAPVRSLAKEPHGSRI